MGSGASAEQPTTYKSVDEALKAGVSQDDIDAYLSASLDDFLSIPFPVALKVFQKHAAAMGGGGGGGGGDDAAATAPSPSPSPSSSSLDRTGFRRAVKRSLEVSTGRKPCIPDKSLRGQLDRLFEAFDADNSGTVDAHELGIGLLCVLNSGGGGEADKVATLFRFADRDGDGFVSQEELVKFVTGVFRVSLFFSSSGGEDGAAGAEGEAAAAAAGAEGQASGGDGGGGGDSKDDTALAVATPADAEANEAAGTNAPAPPVALLAAAGPLDLEAAARTAKAAGTAGGGGGGGGGDIAALALSTTATAFAEADLNKDNLLSLEEFRKWYGPGAAVPAPEAAGGKEGGQGEAAVVAAGAEVCAGDDAGASADAGAASGVSE